VSEGHPMKAHKNQSWTMVFPQHPYAGAKSLGSRVKRDTL
jgi:hypothetical protein